MKSMSSARHADTPRTSPEIRSLSYLPSPSGSFIRKAQPTRRSEDNHSDQSVISVVALANEPRSPKRPLICGFLPLPPISASPMCTPTSSSSSQSPNDSLFSANTVDSTSDATVPHVCELLPSETPTWIATPPTPPSKPLRRSKTTFVRSAAFTAFTPSASFPALMQSHANHNNTPKTRRKRSLSVPTIPSWRMTVLHSSLKASDIPTAVLLSENRLDATFPFSRPNSGSTENERSISPTRIFRLSASGPPSDTEDGSGYSRTMKAADSWSEHSESSFEGERTKDAYRKWHALRELLTTELGYLNDLKALVEVYFQNLSTLAQRSLSASSTFGRSSTSFASGPWLHSYAQLQASAVNQPEGQPLAVPLQPKETPKSNVRYIFTARERESLIRNAEEILQVHENFIRELESLLQPLGITMQSQDTSGIGRYLPCLDQAIRQVSIKFATEASRFNAYQGFCAGHSEALDLVRKAMQQFPLEFDIFERKCASMVSELFSDDVEGDSRPSSSRSANDSPTPKKSLAAEDRKRAMSLTSLDGTVRTLRPRPSMTAVKDTLLSAELIKEKPTRRLAFMDYLIKPVQRICKYPLLLDQLLSSSNNLRAITHPTPNARSDVDVIVESAAQAMRHVASLVDEARHRQDIAVQSSLVLSRVVLPQLMTSPLFPGLTPTFLSSLGTCHLVGSLDVIHYHPGKPISQISNVKAKYLGAILYRGGYLVLVKVSKGKKYEPRHWFSLSDFEVVDVEDDTAMLPCSFKLTCADQHFELAAACKKEKDAWLTSIRESLTYPPLWANEPFPSYKLDAKGDLLPGGPEEHVPETTSGLPTICSIPELGNGSDTDSPEFFFASLRGHGKSRRKRGETPLAQKQETPQAPSRRSSSNSVKAIFSPMSSNPEHVVIRRSSAMARMQVDQELQDVTSRSCLTARSYAFSHEEELFQAPKDGFTRSNSTMGMAGMARLSKHESVRIPRRRTTESLDNHGSPSTTPSLHGSSLSRNVKHLRLTVISPNESEQTSSPSPSPPTSQASSSRASSLRSSVVSSPTSLPLPPNINSAEGSPIKPRSFARNVKSLFHFRPGSPNPNLPASGNPGLPSQLPASPAPPSHHTLGPNTSRWPWESHRRRPRSVHDEPSNDTIFDDPEKSYSIPSRAFTPLST